MTKFLHGAISLSRGESNQSHVYIYVMEPSRPHYYFSIVSVYSYKTESHKDDLRFFWRACKKIILKGFYIGTFFYH